MNDVIIKNADLLGNNQFIVIKTFTATPLSIADPKGLKIYLPPNPEPAILGAGIREAIAKSRKPDWREYNQKFSHDQNKIRYEEWVANVMMRYGYKTRRAMFKGMKSCGIEHFSGVTVLRPSRHYTLEGWDGEGIPQSHRIGVRDESDDRTLGEAALLTLSRCTER